MAASFAPIFKHKATSYPAFPHARVVPVVIMRIEKAVATVVILFELSVICHILYRVYLVGFLLFLYGERLFKLFFRHIALFV